MKKQTSWREEHFHDDVDAGILQLLELPDSGMEHFTLTDAAVLYALDDFWTTNRSDDPDFWEFIAEREPRKHIQERQKTVEAVLVRAVERKELDATIFLRDISNSLPLPLYTYARLSEIKGCLRSYGIWPGPVVDDAENIDTDGLYRRASEIARNRVAIRVGAPPDLDESLDEQTIDELRDEIAAKRMRIATLEHELAKKVDSGKQLGERERTNLYNIIGALLAMLKHHQQDEATVKKFMEEHRYSEIDGLSRRNMEKVFPRARHGIGEK